MNSCVVHWRGKKIKFRTDVFETYKRVLKVLAWCHKRKFPDVNEDDQIAKVREEWHELKLAYYDYFMNMDEENFLEFEREYYYEMADVLFALHGYKRFDEEDANGYLARWNEKYPIKLCCIPLMIEKLLDVYFIRTYVNNRHI